jgi:GDPmannose 4,6-dehydratase
MNEKSRILITGISGQDGSYLSEFLLALNCEIYGIVRRNSFPEHQESRIHHLSEQVRTFYCDMLDSNSLGRIVGELQPHYIFNLAAQSHVRVSFDVPHFTLETNTLGVLNLLNAVRTFSPHSRVYQASSSEMFGTSIDTDGFQRETTPMLPASPYGISKLASFHLARTFRDGYSLFVANGILFNHESPRRGTNFVTNKIAKAVARISYGLESQLYLGNLDSKRDWGHSRDYVRAMWAILNAPDPEDYVVATGETWSVRDFCDLAFKKVGLNYLDFVHTDEKLLRPKEVPVLKGDSSKIRSELGWSPTVSFADLVDEMVEYWLSFYSHQSKR